MGSFASYNDCRYSRTIGSRCCRRRSRSNGCNNSNNRFRYDWLDFSMSLFTVIALKGLFLAPGLFVVEAYGLRFIPAAIARREVLGVNGVRQARKATANSSIASRSGARRGTRCWTNSATLRAARIVFIRRRWRVRSAILPRAMPSSCSTRAEAIGVPARKTAIDFLNPDFAALARYCGGIGPDSRDGDVDHHRWLVPRRDDDVGIALSLERSNEVSVV